MAIDLVNPPTDPHNPDLAWLYAHATLQRLFRPTTDGRNQFWLQVPGIKNFLTRAQVAGTPFPFTDVFLESYLLEFEQGWVALWGGTKYGGWPYHVIASLDVPAPENGFFPAYWWIMAEELLQGINNIISPNDHRPVVFNGHSLGGACAVAGAFQDYDRRSFRGRSAVTFGTPKTRAFQGMSGRDFVHWRVYNFHDIVPFLPINLLKIPVAAFLWKEFWTGLRHYGYPVCLYEEGEFTTENHPRPVPLIALAVLSSTSTRHPFFECHLMEAYTHELRWAMQRQRVSADPFFDMVNAYINEADGLTWNMQGFPAIAPPALPAGYAPPTPTVSEEDLIRQNRQLLRSLNADLLTDKPAVPVLRGQSLASYLSGLRGERFTDVSVRLSSQPVPDPSNITLASFNEISFPGYWRVGGPIWTTSPPPAGAPGQRWQTRAAFQCVEAGGEDAAYCWYLVGHLQSGQEVLLNYQTLGRRVLFDRVKGLSIVIDFAAAAA